MGMDLRPFEAFALTHHGLLHWDAARSIGASRATWYRLIDRHVFEQIHPNVVRVIGSERTRQQRILAGVWGCGRDTVASHRSAAFLWGADRPFDDLVDVILPSRDREATLAGVVVHRPRDHRELRPVIRHGIPCVPPFRMLTDLGAVDPGGVAATLDDLLTQQIVSHAGVRAGLHRHARRGHHGISALRQALDAREIDGVPSDGKLEMAMNDLLTTHHLPPAQFHARVAGYEVDFLISGTCVVLECDGYESHGLNRDQFEFDRQRNAEVTAAGYVIVHFTWRQLVGAPAKVAGRIEANLHRWAPDLLGRRRASSAGLDV